VARAIDDNPHCQTVPVRTHWLITEAGAPIRTSTVTLPGCVHERGSAMFAFCLLKLRAPLSFRLVVSCLPCKPVDRQTGHAVDRSIDGGQTFTQTQSLARAPLLGRIRAAPR
jgi:hypothetical protein